MKTVKAEFDQRISALKLYVASTRQLDELVRKQEATELMTELKKYYRSQDKKTYDYSLVIITLYGILESFIEELAMAYLNKLAVVVPSYFKLPDKIKNNHLSLSADLIINSDRLEKFQDTDKDLVIRNLYDCITGSSPYHINANAFTFHTSNFRPDSLDAFLSNIGIEQTSSQLLKSKYLKAFFVTYENWDEKDFEMYDNANNGKPVKEHKFFEKWIDLVERRNQIAHGIASDLLDLNMLENYIDYISAINNSLFEIIFGSFKKMAFRQIPKKTLGKPSHIYTKPRVIVFDNNTIPLKLNDQIYSYSIGNDSYEIATIQSIHLEKENTEMAVNSLTGTENGTISLALDIEPHDQYEYGLFDCAENLIKLLL